MSIVAEISDLTKEEIQMYWETCAAAMQKEVDSFDAHDVYMEIDLSRVPAGAKLLGCTWVIKWKNLSQQEKEVLLKKPNKCVVGSRKVKARLCIQGCQDPFKFLVPTESPTARLQSLRIQFHLTVQMDFDFESWDVSTAFLRGEEFSKEDRQIFVQPPAEFRKPGKCWLLRKAAYGLGEAPLRFFKRLLSVLVGALKLRQCAYDPCVFVLFEDGRLVIIITTHVDDLLVSGVRKHIDRLRLLAEQHLGELTVETHKFVHLGCELSRDETGALKVSLETFCKHMPFIEIGSMRGRDLDSPVTEVERKALESGVGAGSWVARMCRVDVIRDIAMLQSAISKATVRDLKWYNRVAKRLVETASDAYLMYHKLPVSLDQQVLQVIADSAFKNREEAKSHAGQAVRFAATTTPGGIGNLIDWSSKRLNRAVRSTFGAELLSLIKGIDMSLAVGYIYKDITVERPVHVRLDDFDWRRPPVPLASFDCFISSNNDCRSLWDNMQSNRLPIETNLWPDITHLKHLFNSGIIKAHFWNATGDMCVDALTKAGLDPAALVELMHGHWHVAEEWKEARKPLTFASCHQDHDDDS